LGDSIRVPAGKDRQITLLDLSTHSSGLPRMPSNFRPQDPTDPFADYTVQQLNEFLTGHKLRRQPGEKYEYSNVAVGLLGHALALKCGQSYEEMVRKRICDPLEMRDTCITLGDSQQSRLAAGHDFDNQPKTPFDAAIAASHVVRFKLPEDAGVALGWHVMSDGVIWHNGGTGGYHSYAGFLPAKKAGVVVLSNTAIMHIDQLGRRLLELLTGGEASPLNLPRPIPLDGAALDRFAGKYKLPPLANISVTREGDALGFVIAGQPKIRLYPESGKRFFTRASTDLAISFETDEAGAVTALVIHQGGEKVTAKRAQ
jgi:CubicO group peptidase (beta-lactamase class C family)